MRLIDADMLKHRQLPDKGEPDESESKLWNYFYGYANAIKAVCDMVDAEPTIDAILLEWLIGKELNSEREMSYSAWRVLSEWRQEQAEHD